MIVVTLDLDWAPDYVLDYSFKLLSESGVKATIFTTHDSPAIRNVRDILEIGLHPNVSHLNEIEYAIYELKKSFPEARCIRNHSLVSCSRFFPVYKKYNLMVSSNYTMIGQDNIKPIPMLYGIYEYPIYYADDICLIMCKHFDSEVLKEELLRGSGLKVIAFHPVHIYLNSNNIERYASVKRYLIDKKKTDTFVNKGSGIGTLFKELLLQPSIRGRSMYFPGKEGRFLGENR
ncbi:MAG: hypothetical protein ACFFCW_12755 [Candidatus Hodarchaeota archaeon]